MILQPHELRVLFQDLKKAQYEWLPQTPDRLLSARKNPEPFRPLVQWFGLGIPVSEEELFADGLRVETLVTLARARFIRNRRASMSISGSGDVFVVHDHWPPDPKINDGYVHFGTESAWLARACNRDLEGFIGKNVLDLGCSSGGLLLEVAGVAKKVLGLDISVRAVAWAKALAQAYGFPNIDAKVAEIGEKDADHFTRSAGPWDIALMNPPMVIPSLEAEYPHRDGGELGIELPLRFLEFASRHLARNGQIYCLVTNPIVRGKPMFFEKLPRNRWQFIERTCLHPHFNQSVARKQGYADLGIERVELWYLQMMLV